jgi:hypothetical protein
MNPNMDRKVYVTGFARQMMHNSECVCEDCGPAFVMALSKYEAERLLDHLKRTWKDASGDYHGQVIFKLEALLKRGDEVGGGD